MRTAYIYMIINVINGKFYIGSAWDYKRRISQHKSELRHGKHANSYLQRSWDKYGEEAFEFKILEEFEAKDKNDKFAKEQIYMDVLQPYEDRGYNQSKKAEIGGFCGSDGQSPSIRKYTDEQVIEVKRLLCEGYKHKDIAKITGVKSESINAIKTGRVFIDIGKEYNQKLEEMINKKKANQEIYYKKEKEIYELYESGKSFPEIAEYFGLEQDGKVYHSLEHAKARYMKSENAEGKKCLCCGKLISNRKGKAILRKYCITCSGRMRRGEIKRIVKDNGEVIFEKRKKKH